VRNYPADLEVLNYDCGTAILTTEDTESTEDHRGAIERLTAGRGIHHSHCKVQQGLLDWSR